VFNLCLKNAPRGFNFYFNTPKTNVNTLVVQNQIRFQAYKKAGGQPAFGLILFKYSSGFFISSREMGFIFKGRFAKELPPRK